MSELEQSKPSVLPTWKKLVETVKTRQTHPRNFEEQEDIGTMGEVELSEDKLPLTPLLQLPEMMKGHKWLPAADTDTLRKLNEAETAAGHVESGTVPTTVIVGKPFGQGKAPAEKEQEKRKPLLGRIFGSFGSNNLPEQPGGELPTIDTETLQQMTLQPTQTKEKVEKETEIPGPESYRVGFGGAEITPPSKLTSDVAREAKQKVHDWEETAKEKWRHVREERGKAKQRSKEFAEITKGEQEIVAPVVTVEEEPVKPKYKTYAETYTPTRSHRVVVEKVPSDAGPTTMGLDPSGILDQPTATPTRNTVILPEVHARRLSREEKREIARHGRIWMDDPGALHDETINKMVETADKIAGAQQHVLTAEEKREIAKKDRVWWTSP